MVNFMCSKADCPLYIPLVEGLNRTETRTFPWGRGNSLCLTALELEHCFSSAFRLELKPQLFQCLGLDGLCIRAIYHLLSWGFSWLTTDLGTCWLSQLCEPTLYNECIFLYVFNIGYVYPIGPVSLENSHWYNRLLTQSFATIISLHVK